MPGACPRREYFGKPLPKFNDSRKHIPEKVSYHANIIPYLARGFFAGNT